MDKPMSMSVKDYLIRVMAPKLMVSEKTIEAVINHQFQSANEALKENRSVEISGFGKFLFNEKKAQRQMDKLLSKQKMFEKQANNESLSEQKRASAQMKLNNTLLNIAELEQKLQTNEICSDLRRMEEQADPCIQYEGGDREGEQAENEDM